MQKITGDKAMARDHFNELIKNLRGFEMDMRFGDGLSSAWCKQKNMFQNFHFLEDRIFQHCQGLFFPKDRKSGKEGSTAQLMWYVTPFFNL